MSQIVITEHQMSIITNDSKNKIRQLEEMWDLMTVSEKKNLIKLAQEFYPEKKQKINEHWLNTVGDIVGIFDPTGLVDLANGLSYFYQGDYIFGTLSLISAIPVLGDIAAKPVMGAMKIGGGAAKGLRTAETLAKAGKTTEAAAELAKLAEAPGAVGGFLRKAQSWAPTVISKVEKLPGGLLKGFKNTIIDWLTLLQRAGTKSSKFATKAGQLARTANVTPAKQLQNIKALQNFLETEKIWKSTGAFKAGAEGLTKKGPLAQIFLGGVPRLFGDRRKRILMFQTKFWLGFLDWVGIANFVGPDEAIKALGGEQQTQRLLNQYTQTPQALQYAQQDFPGQYMPPPPTSSFIPSPQPIVQPTSSLPSLPSLSSSAPPADTGTLKGFINNLFKQEMGSALLFAL